LKKDAFPYQESAFNAIKDLPYSGIFHEQGLGKTKIAIDLMLYWLEKKNIDTVFVVTKKQLIHNWEKEFTIHTNIIPKVLTQDKKNNFFLLNSTTRIILTNFETISGEKERLMLYLKTRDVAIVIDESTKIKNPESKLTQDLFQIAPLFKIRTIMTGTPVANRPFDIWAQIFFLDQGKSLGIDFNAFKSHSNLSNDLEENDEKREAFESCVSEIFSKIKGFSVRETKASGVISLPNKIYFNIPCEFECSQRLMYEKLKNEYYLLLQKGDETILDESEVSLKRLLRLIQVASNPRLIDDYYGCESGTEMELSKLLKTIITRGEKVIVWSIFIENVDMFYRKYNEYKPAKIHGKMAIEQRNESVEKFLKDSDCLVLFATPQSAKEGLTLTVANNVIFYDRGFNLDDYLQAQDRIHRISQIRECNIYNMMLKDSIDDWIDILLQAKQNAAHLAQGDYKLAKFSEAMDYGYGNMVKEILGFKEDTDNGD
jgi:SNF2 family DNA or RNA helicase